MAYLPGTHYSNQPAKKKPEELALPGSSFLQSASYDSAQFTLTIDFKNGTQTVHRFVFPMVWEQFKEQQSHGAYFSRAIKGKYPTVKFQEPLKVSDFNRAIKENRPHGNKPKKSTR